MGGPVPLSLEDAVARLTAMAAPEGVDTVGVETVSVAQGLGRVLAEPVTAAFDQPPFAASAMDGWAVRAADLADASAENPIELTRIGEVPAGRPLARAVGPGETARIYTGGALPVGADAVVMQEDVAETASGGRFTQTIAPGRHVRPAGADFAAGDTLLKSGRRLSAGALGLAAAAGRPWLTVRRRPRVGVLAVGDEIALPGEAPGPGRFISSNAFALAGLAQSWGADAVMLGTAADRAAALAEKVAAAQGLDLLLVTGGGGGGAYDVMAQMGGAAESGWENWRLALRPCRAVTVGRVGSLLVLGLPGNPAPAFIGALLLAEPIIRRLSGDQGEGLRQLMVRVETASGPTGEAATASFAKLSRRGSVVAATLLTGKAGGGLLAPAAADALILRPAGAPAAAAGALAAALLIQP